MLKGLNVYTIQRKCILFIFSAFLFTGCRRTQLNTYPGVDITKVKCEDSKGWKIGGKQVTMILMTSCEIKKLSERLLQEMTL